MPMVRRSTPSSKVDDLAFPIRVKVAIPVGGLGRLLDDAQCWLRDNLGRGQWAIHSAPTTVGSAAGFHFRRLEDAQRFVTAFPSATLADFVRTQN